MKKEIFTVPNLLTLMRLILILPIAIFIQRGEYPLALLFVLLSGLTDILDGIIARTFNQVSDLGKIFDPIADKLTQCTLIVCLLKKYKSLFFMIIAFVLRECVVGFLSIYTFKKTKKNNECQVVWKNQHSNHLRCYGHAPILPCTSRCGGKRCHLDFHCPDATFPDCLYDVLYRKASVIRCRKEVKRNKKKSAPKKADFFLYLGVYQGINLCFLPKLDFISE